MRLVILNICLLISYFVFADFARAAEEEEAVELSATVTPEIEVMIQAKSSVQLDRSVLFDASQTPIPAEVSQENLTYEWTFGDGNRQEGVEVVHAYSTPGPYEVLLRINGLPNGALEQRHSIFVYEHSFALITDLADEKAYIQTFISDAYKQNILVDLISVFDSQSEFLSEERLYQNVLDRRNALESSSLFIVWTRGSGGLTLLSKLQQTFPDIAFFRGKNIIFISDENYGSLRNIAHGVFETIKPESIILTRQESMYALLYAPNAADFSDLLEERGVSYESVDEKLGLRPWNLMSHLINFMIDGGVPPGTLRLVLMLPIIVTVVAFMKQVIGLNTLGVYTPSILTLSFIALDLFYGLFFFFSILFIGTLLRIFLKRYRLLYIPRMAILLTFVSLTILLLLFLGVYFDLANVVGIAVFPMLIMSTMVEKFIDIQSGMGLRQALRIVGEALLVAILCYYIAEWGWLKVVVLGHPEIIFLFLLVNIFLARWSGLRLLEYWRFKEVIKYAEE